jgi:hypothetical protein
MVALSMLRPLARVGRWGPLVSLLAIADPAARRVFLASMDEEARP